MNPLRERSAILMIVSGMLVTLVAVALARLAYGLILPSMRASLGLSYEQAGGLGTATALGYLALVMIAGVVASRWSGKAAILLGLFFLILGFFGLSLASHYLVLWGLMAILGVGTAFAFTPLISLLSTWFPSQRGTVIGLLNSGVGLGMLGAGTVIPLIVAESGESGWRLVWALFGCVGVLTGLAVGLFLRNPPLPQAPAAETPSRSPSGSVFRNPHVITVGLIYGIIGLTYIVQAIFMFSFSLDAGLAPLVAGRLAALMGILAILSGPLWGWLSDRIGRTRGLILSLSLVMISMGVPVIWPTYGGFAVHYILMGLTVTGLFTSALSAATEQVGPAEAPVAVSFVTVFFAVGQLAGPAVAGMAVEWTGEFRSTFTGVVVMLFLGIGLSFRLGRIQPEAGRAAKPIA